MPTLSLLREGLSAWDWNPWVLVPLVAMALVYAIGSRAAVGVRAWERHCFWTGWAVLAVALLSPLHPLGQVLFWAHMAQHELLMIVAAPLLVLGRPPVVFLWALQPAWRHRAGLVFRYAPGQGMVFVIHLVAVWGWHIPAAYQATLRSEPLHIAQHVSFLGSALLFWWAVLGARSASREQAGKGLVSIFATAVHTGMLGALLTLSNTAWYPAYNAAQEWGLTPLEDQQLGGLLMWIPPGFVYLGVFAAMFVRWLNGSGARVAVTMTLLSLLLGCQRVADQRHAQAKGLITYYGCQSCHSIPGVAGAQGMVGPPLDTIGRRTYIAGRLVNEPENMIRWISEPKAVDPETAMPDTGIKPEEAREVAAYLYSLR